jgi:2-oxoisovalerate dehydrogenase E2 component (dihydrolipoyl transacylase)
VVTRFAGVHLGLATQTDGGLMVPVIRHAETLDLWACAAAVLRTSEATRNGKATREDLSVHPHTHQSGRIGWHCQHTGHQPP